MCLHNLVTREVIKQIVDSTFLFAKIDCFHLHPVSAILHEIGTSCVFSTTMQSLLAKSFEKHTNSHKIRNLYKKFLKNQVLRSYCSTQKRTEKKISEGKYLNNKTIVASSIKIL